MELELRIYELDPEFRWSWLRWFEEQLLPLYSGQVLGRFLSYRDDATFAWLLQPAEREWDEAEVLATAPTPVRKSVVRKLAPAFGSTITTPEEFRRIDEAKVLEIRQYRIAPGQRARFAQFFHDKTLGPQARHGITVYGQFDDLDDPNNFVWLRGFPNLIERDRRKSEFYRSALWLEELQDEAFSMIEDYSNTLLVMPM